MKTWHQCSDEEKINRWEHVIKTLRKLTPHERKKHFDMGEWGEKTDCGTIACAAGFCGLDPWFRRQGFKLDFKKRFIWDYDYEKGEDVRVPTWEMIAVISKNRISSNISNQVATFFGQRGSENIFFNGANRSVSEVIKEVKEYIKDLKEDLKEKDE